MSIMVEREQVVTAINKFIHQNSLENAIVLVEYLCEVNEVPNKEETVKAVTVNPVIISLILEQVLEEFETKLNICRIVDKNNKLISVF